MTPPIRDLPPAKRTRLGLLVVAALAALAVIAGYLVVTPEPASVPPSPARSSPSRPGAVVESVRSGSWTDPGVWGGRVPGAGDLATITADSTVSFDAGTARVAGVRVDAGGTLTFAPQHPATLESTENVIVEGALVMKPANPSIQHTVRFVSVAEAAFVGGGMHPIASDKGLWVMGAGRLDLAGSPKTGWTRAAGGIGRGATAVSLEGAPAGWRQGDEVSIAPTEPPSAGDVAFSGFDLRTLTGASGANVTLDAGVSRAHPKVNGRWKAEVMNLTRNVMIEGTPTGRSHIFIHSSAPQSILYTAVRHMGPRKPSAANDGFDAAVLGRYGIHFHINDDGSRGSLVQGTVVRDAGAHAYVAHQSHGITFRDDVSYNTYTDGYWWDPSTDTKSEGPETNDTLYDHDIAALVKGDNDEGFRMGGFNLLQGARNEVRDSVAVGVQGNNDNPRALAAGFVWPESFGAHDHGVWNFSRGNLAHNNAANGIFNWQNDGLPHVLNDFVAYHNGNFGISQGAYLNEFNLLNVRLYGNAGGAIMAMASSGFRDHVDNPVPEHRLRFDNVVMDGAGQSDYLVVAQDHNADGTRQPVLFRNATMRGFRKAAIAMRPGDANEQYAMDFVDSRIAPNQFWFVDSSEEGALPSGNFVRVQNRSTAYRVNTRASGGGTPTTAWNARKQTIRPFFGGNPDGTTPQVTFVSPTGGDHVAGVVSVSVFAFDNVAVTSVRLLVDGVLEATDRSAPFSFRWDTARLADGSRHRLQLRAADAAGNTNVSGVHTVFVGTGGTP